MALLTFDEALDAIANDQFIKSEMVQTRALERIVWQASNGSPGCLSDYFTLCLTKKDAIESALFIADSGEGAPRGMRSRLEKDGIFYDQSGYIYRVERMKLRDLF